MATQDRYTATQYKEWCEAAGQAALRNAAARNELSNLQGSNGKLFESFLSARGPMDESVAEGLLRCGMNICGPDAGTSERQHEGKGIENNRGRKKEYEIAVESAMSETNQKGKLCPEALGAFLILGDQCLDLCGEMIKDPTRYEKMWDLLFLQDAPFLSQRSAHMTILICTELAKRGQQCVIESTSNQDMPQRSTKVEADTGHDRAPGQKTSIFMREVIVNRNATHRLLNWLRFESSARDLILEMLSAPGCPPSVRIDPNVLLSMMSNSQANGQTETDGSQCSSTRSSGRSIMSSSNTLSLCDELLERCANLPADTLGSRLCYDMFENETWANGLVDCAFNCFTGKRSDFSRCEDAMTFLGKLLSQLDGGCVAEISDDGVTSQESDENPSSHQECLSCESPIVKACLLKIDCLNEHFRTASCLDPLMDLQALNILEKLMQLECKKVDNTILEARVLEPVVGSCCGLCEDGVNTVSASKCGNAMWLAKIRRMLCFALLDKDPEMGELFSYRRPCSKIVLDSEGLIVSSAFADTMRHYLTVTLDLPGKVADALLRQKRSILATASERAKLEGTLSRRERSRCDLFRAHLVHLANILQHQEHCEKKKQRKRAIEIWKERRNEAASSSKCDGPVISPVAVGYGRGGAWSELVAMPNTVHDEAKHESCSNDSDLLTNLNLRVFGRATGAFQNMNDFEASDESDFDEEYYEDFQKEDGSPKARSPKSPNSPESRKSPLLEKGRASPKRFGSPKKLHSTSSPTSGASLSGLGILPSTSSEKILAHDVVEQVMATSLATMRQLAKETRKTELATIAKQRAMSPEAAADLHKSRMQRAQNRFGLTLKERKELPTVPTDVLDIGNTFPSQCESYGSNKGVATSILPDASPIYSPSASRRRRIRQRIAEAAAEDGDDSNSDSSSESDEDNPSKRHHLSNRRIRQRPHYEGKTGGSLSAASPAVRGTRSLVCGVRLPSTLGSEDCGSSDEERNDDEEPEGKRGGSVGARRALIQGKALLPSSYGDSSDSSDSDDEQIRTSWSDLSISTSSAGGKSRK